MKILLVANYLPDKQESMLRFADLLLEALQPHGHEVRLIRPKVILNRSQASYEEGGKWWGYLDKFVLFSFHLKRAAHWANVTHVCDHSNAFYIHFLQHQAHIINCHDLIAIRAALDSAKKTKRSGRILQTLILRGLQKAANFACISENTKRELEEVAGVVPEKAAVIYMGINSCFTPMDKAEARDLLSGHQELKSESAKPFILHVGGNQPYKNRMGVLRIYQKLRLMNDSSAPQLILVGKPWTDEMHEFIADHHLEAEVSEVQTCTNLELRALYSLAEAFLFPSLAEGFGWPAVEAQACGCRVLTSDFAPLTEIGGEAAVYCDPRDENEAAHKLNGLLAETEEQRIQRIRAGLQNAAKFSSQSMIEGYLALYQKAIREHIATK